MPTKKLSRLDRLAGDGKNSGGGIPLPPLFQTVVGELLDHDARTVGDFIAPVQQAIPNMARVNMLYPGEGYEGLITDVLEQLKSKGLASYSDGAWKMGDKFQEGKAQNVIPGRKTKNNPLKITVYSKEERDRRSAATRDDRELQAMYTDLRNDRMFSVRGAFPRGRLKRIELKLHTLARTIPQMPLSDFLDLGADIRANGVKIPIILFEGQVLDGRHRLAAASALNVPLRLEEFDGDAVAHVTSLNLIRRHMTGAQKALIVQELYLPKAEVEAREGQQLGDEQGQAEVRPMRGTLTTPETEAIKVAVERSHLTEVSVRAMQRMQLVRNAPQTQERIRSGEITTVSIAEREALKELGQDPKKDALPAQLRKPFRALGDALYKLEMAHTGLAGGTDDVDQILHRIQEIRELLDRTEALLTIKSETGKA